MAKMSIDRLLALSLVFVVTTGLLCLEPVKSENNGYTSYSINNDGTITPATAPIQLAGNIYTLTGDIRGSVTVERSNIILNGNGHAIIGGADEIGIGGITIGSLPTAPTAGISYISNVTAKNFKISGSIYGISVWQGSNVIIANNSISETGNSIIAVFEGTAGINVEGGGSNTIIGNILTNNSNGITFLQTENNLIVNNKIENSANSFGHSSYGIVFSGGARFNTIYHNDFRGNAQQAFNAISDSPSPVNVWDDGYPSGGNYWSDYHSKYPRAQMIGDSGIVNVSYVIDSQNKDNYPLLSPFDYNLYLFRTTKPDIQMLSVENHTYSSNNVLFNFTVDKATSWIGYSFDGQQNVTVMGNFTIANMTNGMHNVAIYANDSFGNMDVQTSNFNVNQINSTAKTYQITTQTLVIITIVAVIVIAALLSLFRRHRKTINLSQ